MDETLDPARRRYLQQYWEGQFALIDAMTAPYRREGAVLLDVGCGQGRTAKRLAQGVTRYIGLNLDEEELRIARQNNPEPMFEFLHGNAMDMSAIADRSVDLIVLIFVMEHIEFPEKLFSEIRRTLKSQGAVLLVAPNLLTGAGLAIRLLPPSIRQWLKKMISRKEEVTDYPTFYRCNTVGALDRMAARFGLKRDRLEMQSGIGYFYRYPGFHHWHRFLTRISAIGPLRRFKGFIFVTYRKAG
jgi:SAM-dependent methyltransferase